MDVVIAGVVRQVSAHLFTEREACSDKWRSVLRIRCGRCVLELWGYGMSEAEAEQDVESHFASIAYGRSQASQ